MGSNVPDPVWSGQFLFPVDYTVNLPASVDLRTSAPPIEDQGSVGDCTANGIDGCLEFFQMAAVAAGTVPTFTPLSELFNYWNSRYILFGTAPTSDTGSTAQAALMAVSQYGVCTEALWPQTENELTKPSAAAYADALTRTVAKYYQYACWGSWFNYDTQVQGIRYILAKGYPVIICANVGEMLETLTGEEVYMPINATTNPMIGGHCFIIVGCTGDFNAGTFKWICRNSWGPDYCMAGCFYADPTVVLNDSTGLFVIEGFMGQTTVGPDLTTIPVPPTDASTCDDVVTYVFQTKFGRVARAAGEAFWTSAVSTWLMAQIIAGAAPADMAYMAAHPVQIAPTFVSTDTIDQVVTTVFQTYFGRAPLPAGESYWAAAALAYFTTQIVAGAGAADQQFMLDNNIT